MAQVLAQDGVFCSSLPLLHIEPLPATAELREPLDHLERYALVIVVSKPAARLALQLLADERGASGGAQWFAVGAGTAQVLRDAGIPAQYPDDGDDSEALLRLPALCAALDHGAPRVLILRGEGGREWLAQQLAARGATVDYMQLYRRQQPSYPIDALRQRIGAERLNGVVVSSGQGFDNLLALAGEDAPLLLRMPLFVPSDRVAKIAAAAGAWHVVNCAGASALALRETLRRSAAPLDQVCAFTDKNA